MAFRTIVNNFTRGELDPRFLAMVDYEGYHKGCREFKNVVCIPQGGCTRRFGTVFEGFIENNGIPVTDIDDVRIFSYEFDDESYFIVIRPQTLGVIPDEINSLAFDIWIGGELVATVNPDPGAYTTDQIREIRWASWNNRIILFHEDVQMHQLIRNDMDDWEIKIITPVFYPTFDYTTYDDPNQPYTSNGETFTPGAASGSIVFVLQSGTSTPFTDNHVGGLIYGNSGTLRITSINNSQSVNGYTLTDFANTNPIRGDELIILEKGWGNGSNTVVEGQARGWPAHGVFYQGRLVAAKWKIERSRGSASTVNGAFDWDDSDDDATTGWSFEAGKDGNDTINDVVAFKSLVTMGRKGPSSTSILVDVPTIPTNVFFNAQGTEGSARIDSQILNNQIIYVGKNFDIVYSMYFDIPDSGFTISEASALSTHLITEGRWADIFDPAEKDGRYYLLVNEDGTIAAYQTIAEENISAWSEIFTTGSFVDIAGCGDEARALIRRKINTGNLIEGELDKVYTVDSTFNVFTDETADTYDDSETVSVFSEDESYIVLGLEIQFNNLDVTIDNPAISNINISCEYLHKNNQWTSIDVTDNTLGFTVSGTIEWSPDGLSSWEAKELNGIKRKYWFRIKRNLVATDTGIEIFTIFANTANRIYIEKLDFDVYMDSIVEGFPSPGGDIFGLEHLIGQKAYVFSNNFPMGEYLVDDAGKIHISEEFYQMKTMVGLDYKVDVVPMPVVAALQNGYNTYHPQHIVDAHIDYYESLGITANGQQVIPVVAGEFLTTYQPKPVTDYYEIPVHKGWEPRQEIRISQSYPAPMTLLGIGLTVEIT